ncbi:MAG: prohibitin family protein [Proteobacteria bacterium]|nr:prohibitin family protein [Pseudomonadota bacterium]MBU1740042.1 prohibitin family protein [Pseudomonadota bacterium]
MTQLVIAAIVIVAAVVIKLALGRSAQATGDARAVRTFNLAGRLAIIGGPIVAVIILVSSMITVVPAGHVGVLTLFGKVNKTPLGEGLHIINPLLVVHKMSIRISKISGRFSAASSDMQQVNVIIALNIALDPAQAPAVYRTVGFAYVRKIVDPAVQEVLKGVTALYQAQVILQKRPLIKAKVFERLKKWLSRYGVVVREVSLSNIEFNKDYQTAIERKQIQQQRAEELRYKLQQAKLQAKIRVVNAKAQAQAEVESARGRGQRILIEGKALARRNKLIALSLTAILIQDNWIKRWDGRLPRFITGGKNVPFLININPATAK